MCLPSTFWQTERRTVVIPITSQFGCLELLITQTFLLGPVKFEIMRVDCIYFEPCMNYGYHEIVFLFSHGHGRIRVFSVKVALSHLCSGKLIDKLRCKYDFKVNGYVIALAERDMQIIFFLFVHENICCGASNEYHKIRFLGDKNQSTNSTGRSVVSECRLGK